MFKARWLLALLAVLTAVAVYRLWRFGNERSPATHLAAAEVGLDQIPPDYRLALRELDRGFTLASEEQDAEALETILVLRADVNRRNQAPMHALRDYRMLVERYRPDDLDILRTAARTAINADELDVAFGFIERWLELQPKNGGAWIASGEIELRRAELLLAELGEELDLSLSTEVARKARAAALQVAYLPRRSARRAAPYGRFVSLRDPAQLGSELARLEEISTLVSTARESFARSLRYSPNSRALSFVQRILRRAGLESDSALVGLHGMGVPNFIVREDVLAETTLALAHTGRLGAAGTVWRHGVDTLHLQPNFRSLPHELAFGLAGVLLRLGFWEDLEAAAEDLAVVIRRDQLEVDLRHLEAALLIAQGSTEAGRTLLAGIDPEEPELYPGGHLDAFLQLESLLAEAGMARGHVWSRITRLGADVEPGDPLAPRIAAAWEEMARATYTRGDHARALVNLAEAMSLVGEEPELVELWERWGAAAMEANGRDPESNAQRFASDALALDSGAFSPYEILETARVFARRGDFPHARNALAQLRSRLPDLPQALLLDGLVQLGLGDLRRGAATWARRLEVGGPGLQPVLEHLSTLPWETIPGPTRLRLLRAAPYVFGPYVRLRNLAADGREAEAIAWVERRDLATLGAGLRVEAARLYARSGRWDRARAILASLPPETPAAAETAGLFLQAMIRTPEGIDGEGLERVALGSAGDVTLGRSIDDLLANGRTAEAALVLERLLREPRLREPAIAERHLALRLAETGSILERLGELRAWVGDEAAALLPLASAIDSQLEDEIEREAAELAGLPFAQTPYRASLCEILTGRTEQAAVTLASLEGQAFGVREAQRLFALELAREEPMGPGDDTPVSYGEARLFTRFLAVALFTLERPTLVPWTLSRLRSLPPVLRDDPRVPLLEALALAALGANDRAEALTVNLCESGTRTAWLIREELARERLGAGTPAFHRLRTQRLAAFGNGGMSPDELALHQARQADEAGRPEQALAILELGCRQLPGAVRLLEERARLDEELHGVLAALPDYHELFETLSPSEAGAHAPHYLELLHQAHRAGELSERALRAYVEALSVALPGEPAAIGELARLAAEEGTQDGLSRAWEILESFRSAVRGSLEELQPGEGRRWLELFRRYDPDRGLAFAERELAANPESPDVWNQWIEALHAARRFQDAFDELTLLARFHPEPDVLERIPLYAVDLGHTREEVELLVRQAVEGIRLAGGDLAARDPAHALALACFGRAEPLGDVSLSLLEARWQEALEERPGFDRRRLTAVYALALLQADVPDAQPKARAAVGKLVERADEELSRHLAEVVLALTRKLKAR